MLTHIPTNEQVIHHLRQLINHQKLNLLDPNRCVLNTIIGSVIVGRKFRKKKHHFFIIWCW